MKLDVCFIGVGSIARRHIKNLRQICEKNNIELHIDALRHNDEQKKIVEYEQIGIENSFYRYDEIDKIYDAVFITNPTQMHLETLCKSVNIGKNFFIEKPIISYSQIKMFEAVHLKDEAIYYVACPLRYNAVIQYIKKNVNPAEVISVRSISSSYLPEWRPGVDYRNTYSASKAMGGGVGIDLIHEWDYLTYLFGKPETIYFFSEQKSELEIDSEDVAIYIARYLDKTLELHLDYFGRKTIREIMLFTRDDTIVGNLVDNTLHFLRSNKKIDFHEERDDFQKRELQHFIDMVISGIDNDSTVEHAIDVLKISQGRL